MPGWYVKTEPLRDKLQPVGIILEQHPERTRLFMQWQQMDFPLMHDPFNLLELPFVPVTLLLDEHGVIQLASPKQDQLTAIEKQVLDQPFDPPATMPPLTPPVDLAQLRATAETEQSAERWLRYADALVLWGTADKLDQAVIAGEAALALAPTARIHFHLGVIYRKRYDSALRQAGDFQQAVAHWTAALTLDPNNYIWRRRLQQYGPRLDKPYSFYDWVMTAREEIRQRGEEPHPLLVEPGGAEFAYPAETFTSDAQEMVEPDPEGRIFRDEAAFVQVEAAVVPAALVPGDSARLHVTLEPTGAAHWNNETDDLALWLDLPEGWQAESSLLTFPNPATAISTEPRKLEIEVQGPADAMPGVLEFSAYALYYICKDANGTCLYRRQDFTLQLTVQPPNGRRLRDGG